MRKGNVIRLVLALIFLITTVVFIMVDNEVVFPSAMVGFFMMLTLIADNKQGNGSWAASKWAIICFSIMVMVLNVVTSLFLPGIAAGMDFSHHAVELTTSLGTTDPDAIREHFVQVNINDMHELCYTTSLLLVMYLMSYGMLVIKNRKRAVV